MSNAAQLINGCLPVTIVAELIVGSHGDQRTPRRSHGIEDLHGRLTPYLQHSHSITIKCRRYVDIVLPVNVVSD